MQWLDYITPDNITHLLSALAGLVTAIAVLLGRGVYVKRKSSKPPPPNNGKEIPPPPPMPTMTGERPPPLPKKSEPGDS